MSEQKIGKGIYHYHTFRINLETEKKLLEVKKKIGARWDDVFNQLVKNYNKLNPKK